MTDPGTTDYAIAVLEAFYGKKPPGWEIYDKRLSVIGSHTTEADGRRWLHLSIASPKRLPRYEELKYLKRHWAGDAAKAIEVHAPAAEHVDIHHLCRHLWICLDGDPLPDFTHGTGVI